ncbi:MAG TPA: hypothetical protein VGC30_04085 [Dokdonella sp.]
MAAPDKHSCGHPNCECVVEGPDAFCSAYCAQSAATPDDAREPVCACGHADCTEPR